MDQSREKFLRRHIAKLAQDVFPDDDVAQWHVIGIQHDKAVSVVEMRAAPETPGYEKYKLAVLFEKGKLPEIVATYAFEEGRYSLLSAVKETGTPAQIPEAGPAHRASDVRSSHKPGPRLANRTGIWFEGLFASLSALVLAGILMTVWISPLTIENGRWVRLAVGILVLEFVMIHSGVLMGALSIVNMKGRWWLYGGLFVFYTIFILAITLHFKSWSFLAVYSAVMFTRWLGMLRGENLFNDAVGRSVASILGVFLIMIPLAIFPVPRLGITDSILWMHPTDVTGHMIDHPEYALAMGVMYFSWMAAYEWLAMKYQLRVAALRRPAAVPA